MRLRIFFSICLASFLTLALSLILVTRIMYGNMSDDIRHEVRNEAGYISLAVERMDENALSEYISETGKISKNRITFIDNDGTVLYDNYADASNMENHSEREEVKSALQTGTGEATRLSDTIDEVNYYYAVRLSDNKILRVANTSHSIGGLIGKSTVGIVIVVIAVIAAAVLTAGFLAKTIISPINNIDLDNPVSNYTYEELSPLLARMDKQNEKIQHQIEKLSRQKQEFNYITANMNEGLVILGKHGNVITANSAAKNILGGEEASDYAELCRDTAYIKAVETALSGTANEAKLERDGCIYQITANPVIQGTDEATGEPVRHGAVLFLVDITDRENSEQMRREFSANVSHELKTPLTSIMGAAEIIQTGIAKKEDIPHFAGQIHSEASRLLVLIEDIIKLSRLDEEGLQQEFEQVELDKICETVIAELGCKAKDKKVRVKFDGESVKLYGVKAVLHEMIYNLCDNAIAYNKPNGEVKISLHEEDGKKILSVADTGIGIPHEHHARVFERFYRVDKSHSKETGGTGLGLSIVKHGAILHDGSIDLQSEPDKGTKITISF